MSKEDILLQTVDKSVICLGKKFKDEESRREYFREELRKKLPILKTEEGFPIGEDDDIIKLSDPPYYTACPNPWMNEFLSEWKTDDRDYHVKPYATDVSEGKQELIYNVHTYHTKVPPKAIMRYLLHFTEPGDVIVDGFSGTGMTGVAANYCGIDSKVKELGFTVDNTGAVLDNNIPVGRIGERKTFLQDLSPQASFISQCFNKPMDKEQVNSEANRILKVLEEEFSRYFQTERDGVRYKVNYFVWSDVFICPSCQEEVVFYEAASNENGKVQSEFLCPHCTSHLTKKMMERAFETFYDFALNSTVTLAKQKMVLVNYTNSQGKKVLEPCVDYDYNLLSEVNNKNFDSWIPIAEIPDGEEIKRVRRIGITNVHQLYFKREQLFLSRFKELISESNFSDFLTLLFTSQLINISKLNRYRPEVSFPYNPMSGTMYIGSLISEANPFDAYYNKLKKFTNAFILNSKNTVVSTQSSTTISLEDASVDYIFTDPPFGANLMYSELSFMWETWLGVITNNQKEAIINSAQKKGTREYTNLMNEVFKEYYRVLKPGRWITVEFSNSKASVWNSIQESLQKAGFIIANVSALDKQQGSFKAVTTTTAVKQDLVISAYKPTLNTIEKMIQENNTVESAWTFVTQHLEQLDVFRGVKGEVEIIAERTPRILFDRMVAYHVQNGLSVPISSAEFQDGIAQRFLIRDGMAFLESQVAEYDRKRILVKEFTQMSLFVSDENSAIEWIRQQLIKKPQTRQELHPNYMKEIQHIAKHELLPELDDLLNQNFLRYEGDEDIPNQITTYLRANYPNLRGIDKKDPILIEKSRNRWYVPNPNKQADLEKLREKSLLREFESYIAELEGSKKKLKQFRTEAIRVGFKKAYSEKNFEKIVKIGDRLPASVIQEDNKLLMYYDNACIRLGL